MGLGLGDGELVGDDFSEVSMVIGWFSDDDELASDFNEDCQLVLLLNGPSSENMEKACMTIVQADDLPFVSIASLDTSSLWKLHELKESIVYLQMDSLKVRGIPHSVIAPLAVSASRGVACVFATRKRALVYILDEDEDEISDAE
ncbi:anaphase-promoting complex subunit 4-like [Bidens hawaiensis]|uniref:anaphase-promoting complex subunit 4-like n=1 Tax=Bidens hawaiensis TaxID=980011 RepID=UPI00404B2BFD